MGGAAVGLAGAAFTLNIAPGWIETGISGNGWIALAIVIFGGWYPLRVAFGVYLVSVLRTLASGLQTTGVPIEVLNPLPRLLMILTLLHLPLSLNKLRHWLGHTTSFAGDRQPRPELTNEKCI